jgi:hypothetical protein
MPIDSERTFHHFTRLPLELRIKIWSYALPEPKIVDVIAISTDDSQELFYLPTGNEGWDHREQRVKWVRTFVDRMVSPRQDIPALLGVERQTRELVLRRWKVLGGVGGLSKEMSCGTGFGAGEGEVVTLEIGVGGDESWRFKAPEVQGDGVESMFYFAPPSKHSLTLFNPALDVLFLADPPSSHLARHVPSLSVLVRWLDRSVIESVRRLAVPYCSWRKDRTFNQLGSLLRFKSLERLWVCFVGDGRIEGSGGSWGWLVAVGRVGDGHDSKEGYLGEVREQVMGDVEELGRREMEWRRPSILVVRDRGEVMSELME